MKKLVISILTLIATIVSIATPTFAVGEIVITYTSVNLVSTYYALQGNTVIPAGTNYVEITLPSSMYSVSNVGGINATIIFKNSGTTVETYDFVTDFDNRVYGVFQFDISEITVNQVYVNLTQSYSSTPSGYTTYFNANSSIEVFAENPLTKQIYFVDQGSVVDVKRINNESGINTYEFITPTPPTDYTFLYWATAEGLEYQGTSISDDMLIDNVFYLYAKYVPEGDVIVVDDDLNTAPAGFQSILAVFGVNDTVGYVLVYVIINIAAFMFLIFKFNANTMTLIVAAFAITGTFMFLNILPFYVPIVVTLICLFAFKNLAGVISNE